MLVSFDHIVNLFKFYLRNLGTTNTCLSFVHFSYLGSTLVSLSHMIIEIFMLMRLMLIYYLLVKHAKISINKICFPLLSIKILYSRLIYRIYKMYRRMF